MLPVFCVAHAAHSDWRQAVEECLERLQAGGANLGFLYVTDYFADSLGPMLELLRGRTGVEHWVGSVGVGVCATGREYLDEPAAVVMLAEFDPAAFRVFSGFRAPRDVRKAALECRGGPGHFAIAHADPLNQEVAQLVRGVAGNLESGFVVGGLASSRHRNLQIADGVVSGAVSGVAFSDQVTVATRLTQGCTPVGPKHIITECERNVIVTLDNQPALEVLLADMGEGAERDAARVAGQVFAGLPVAGSDTGDYMARNVIGADPARGLIAVGEIVKTGGHIMFCRRDANSAREDMGRMLASIKQGLYGKPRGGVYFSCLGRGAGLFGPGSVELKMIESELGEFPLAGFFCNGEISHNRLYGYTGVLTLFT
jgi:small ligand-binding sensory domain FIST